jgi:thiamine biosynthesis lipoprotein
MGTTWSVRLFTEVGRTDRDLRDSVTRELDRLVAQMSHWRSDSDLSRFNNTPPGLWVDLPEDLYRVFETALAISEQSGGAFDATVGPLVDAWGFGPGQIPVNVPLSEGVIGEAALRRNSGRVLLDRAQRRAFQPGGVCFDLSSIAKGFAVDRVVDLLDEPSVSSCLVEIGGELRGRGVKPGGDPWWVSIERPPDTAEFPDTLIALCGLSIATSGDYRRFFEHGGTRYSHTIDPRTGAPVRHALASVTVIHEHCMLADAWSTALAVMGPEEGLDFADQHGLAAQFVLRGNAPYQVRHSKRFCSFLES